MKKIILASIALSFIAGHVVAQSLEKGIQYYNYERYQSAQNELKSLIESNPEANYYYGLSQLGLDNINGAAATFSKDPAHFYNQAGMARVFFLRGNSDNAAKKLNEVVDKAKKKDWEKYKVAADAITYTKGGNVQDAISWYQKALEREANNALLLIGLGDAYFKLQTGGGASMDNYEHALNAGTHNSLAYSRIGKLWYVARNYKSALDSYQKAKDADIENPLPYRDLANAYLRAGNYDKALENDEMYLQKSDQSINDQITYANILFLSKKYTEAEQKIESLIAAGHEKPSMYRLIAFTSYETKAYKKALNNMNTFFAQEKDEGVLEANDFLYLGKIYSALALEDTAQRKVYSDSAEFYFNKALTLDADAEKTEIYREIAEGYKNAKVYDKAGEFYGKIVAEDPETGPLDYYYWGFWSFYGQEYDVASTAFKAMNAKYPNEGSALYWLARVESAKDSEAKEGLAVEPFKNWLAFETEGYIKKQQDLMVAYQYLAYYYYNQNSAKDCLEWANKILDFDAENQFANQLVDYFKAQK